MNRRNKGLLAALFSTLFFSSYSVFGKLLLQDLAPETLLLLSQSISVLVLVFFFGLLPELKILKKLSFKSRFWIFMVAILSGVIAPLLALTGLKDTSAVNAIMLGRLEVVAAGFISVLWLKEKISLFQGLGTVLMLIGVGIISTQGFKVGLNFSGGDSFVIAAAFVWAFSNAFFKSFLHRLKPEIMVLVRNAIGALTVLFIVPWFFPIYHDFTAMENREILRIVIIFSVFSVILAQFLWYRSIELISTSLASVITLLMPFFGVILAVLILQERLFMYHLWGGMLVLAGLIFTVIHRHRHPKDHHGFWQRLRHGFH